MKRFLSLYTADERTAGVRPSTEHMAEMGKLIEEGTKAGTLLATGALLPISKGGARVRCSGGKLSVIDGPFTEARELIAGFAVIQRKSKEEAIEGVRRFLRSPAPARASFARSWSRKGTSRSRSRGAPRSGKGGAVEPLPSIVASVELGSSRSKSSGSAAPD